MLLLFTKGDKMINQVFINGILYNYEDLYYKLHDTLEELNYANIHEIAFRLKIKPLVALDLLNEYIIKYVKENPDITLSNVCKNLKVKSSYIMDLIDDGVITISVDNVDEVLESEKYSSVLNADIISKEKRRDAIKGLNDSFNSGPKLVKEPKAAYHTNYSSRNRK